MAGGRVMKRAGRPDAWVCRIEEEAWAGWPCSLSFSAHGQPVSPPSALLHTIAHIVQPRHFISAHPFSDVPHTALIQPPPSFSVRPLAFSVSISSLPPPPCAASPPSSPHGALTSQTQPLRTATTPPPSMQRPPSMLPKSNSSSSAQRLAFSAPSLAAHPFSLAPTSPQSPPRRRRPAQALPPQTTMLAASTLTACIFSPSRTRPRPQSPRPSAHRRAL